MAHPPPKAWQSATPTPSFDTGSGTRPALPRVSLPPPAPTSAPAPSGNLSPGEIVAERYCIQEQIAIGGMGRVYRAEQVPLGRPVALKVLDAQFVRSNPEFNKQFLMEAASCARIAHPNVVTVYDYGRLSKSSAAYFMAMELVEGESLMVVQRRERRMHWSRALRLTYEIARGLRAAHRTGAVHRDLKPSNIMVVPTDEGESVKVLDFGLVQMLDQATGETSSERRVLGSPPYMAPEQIQMQAVDGRTDIYALGVILYRLLAGKLPFGRDSNVETFRAHVHTAPPPLPPEVRDTLPPGLEIVLFRCLEKSPDRRWPDAGALVDALRRVHRHAAKTAPLGQTVPPPSPRHSQITVTGPLPRVDVAAIDIEPDDDEEAPTMFASRDVSITPAPSPKPARRGDARQAMVTALVIVLATVIGAALSALTQ